MKAGKCLITIIGALAVTLCLIIASASAASLILPTSLQSIEEEAFFGDTSIDEVILPEGIKSIGDRAFADSSITSIYLPSSINHIGDYAFQNTTVVGTGLPGNYAQEWFEAHGLVYHVPTTPVEDFEWETINGLEARITKYLGNDSRVYIPAEIDGFRITGLQSGLFRNRENLEYVFIPQTVKDWGINTFADCPSLTTVSLENGLTTIGIFAFRNCTSLRSINIPDSVTDIGQGAFSDCGNLSEFHYPLNLNRLIGYTGAGEILKNCKKITTIDIPEGITRIPNTIFQGCNYISNIEFPSTLEIIGDNTFNDCDALTQIVLPPNLKEIQKDAFSRCDNLQKVVLPDGILSVGVFAFRNDIALTEINLPDSITGIGQGVFLDCENLSAFHYPLHLDHLIGYSGAGEILKNCKKIKTIVIPEGVIAIPNTLFDGCNYLEYIQMPSTLTSIGSSAFRNCNALLQTYISPKVTEIGSKAFGSCPNLTIWCEYGSTVLQYCKDNSVDYYYLTPDEVNSPSGSLYKGDHYSLHGYARASIPLTNVTATIWNSDKSETIQTISVVPSVTDYALSGEINYNLLFNSLPLGNYCYTLTASTELSTEVWADNTFSIVPPPLRVGVSGFSEYSDLVESDSLKLRGTVHSNYIMDSLTVYLLNPSKNAVITQTINPGSKSYALSSISLSLANVISETYTLRIVVNANGETKTALQTPVTINNSTAIPAVTEEMREEVLEFLRNKKVGTFNPGTLVDTYFANMSTWDVITMGLSDYNSITLSKFKDWLSGSDYDSYMVEKYEAEIAQLLKDMYDNSDVEILPYYGTFPKLIKNVGSVLKDTTGYMLDNMNENIDELKIAFGAPGQFEEMETLELLKDIGKGTTTVMKGLKYTDEFVDFLEEMMADHAQALAALDVIAETYNPDGNPNFSQALSLIKASYKSKLGKAIIEVCKRAANYAMKETNKTITKSVLSLAGASAGSLYSLADTAAELVVKYSGLEAIGQDKVDFITQYTSLSTLQGAFDRACSDAIVSYSEGDQISDTQINRIQVTFVTCRQALIRLYQTTKGLDNQNAATYDTLINETKSKTMPGVAPIQ